MCFYEVKDLRNDKNKRKLRSNIPNKPGVYKWWCRKDLLEKFLKELDIQFDECAKDIEVKNNFDVLKVCDNGYFYEEHIKNSYYCIYVGESKNLKRRIFNNHLGSNIKGSTLRHTICAILVGYDDKLKVNELQDEMIIEIMAFPLEEYQKKQYTMINEKFRPLNNDDICPNSSFYSKKRYYYSAGKNKSPKSKKITYLRAKLKAEQNK